MNTIIIKITLVRSEINLFLILKRENRLLWMCNSVKNPYDNIEAKYYHEQAITPLMLLPLTEYDSALFLLHVIKSSHDYLACHLGSSSLLTIHKCGSNK